MLKQNAYIQMTGDAPGGGARLANLHLTLIQNVFGSSVSTFGAKGAEARGSLPGLLA